MPGKQFGYPDFDVVYFARDNASSLISLSKHHAEQLTQKMPLLTELENLLSEVATNMPALWACELLVGKAHYFISKISGTLPRCRYETDGAFGT
jgi:hypothetical protein